jgi:hypothetical protein
MVFESASIQTMVYVLKKASAPNSYDFEFRKIFLKEPTSDQLKEFLYTQIPSQEFDVFSVNIDREKNSSGYLNFVKEDFHPTLNSIASAISSG